MIQRKHTFCLGIPWPFAPSSRVSKSEDRSKFSTHSDTNFPIQRLTSPTNKTKEPSNSELKRNSPSHHTQPPPTTTSVFIESSVPSRAGSPSRVSIASSSPKTRPQSPAHLASDGIIEMGKLAAEERFWPAAFELDKEEKFVSEEPIPQEAEPKASSPVKSIAKSSWETAFQPEKVKKQPQDTEQKASSDSAPVSKTEPASNQSPPPPPPPPLSPLASEHTDKALNRNADESALPASLASQEEKEMLVQQETESKEKSHLEAIIMSSETSFQPENMSKQLQETEQRASSEPSTPVSKIEPPHTSSPSASTLTSEMLKHNAEETTLPESPSYESILQDFESKMKSPLKTSPNSPETSSKPESKKPDSDGIAGSSKAPWNLLVQEQRIRNHLQWRFVQIRSNTRHTKLWREG